MALLLLSPGSWHAQDFVRALQEWNLFSSVLWGNPPGLQSHIPWGSPVLLPDPQARKPDMRFRTFTTVGELLWYYCSPDCGLPTWKVRALILSCLCPLLPSCFSIFVSGRVVSFFGGSSVLLSVVVQQVVVTLVLLQEEMRVRPSTPPS